MAQQVFPTKSNLMATKRSLALAEQGYDLMDRKRNILVREMMQLIDRAAGIQDRISAAYAEAYDALQKANIVLGEREREEFSRLKVIKAQKEKQAEEA